MSRSEEQGCPDDCRACNNPLIGAVYFTRTVCAYVAVVSGAGVLIWDVSWWPAWLAACAWTGITAGLWSPVLPLMIQNWYLRWQVMRRDKLIVKQRDQLLALRQERIQLELLYSQRQTEIAQKNAYAAALKTQLLELERMVAQRKLEQEARDARRRLDAACAAIEADRLEAAAWRMEFTVKQLEIKLNQADLFESLSVIDDNAQDRIIAAYEQGFDHGQRGIVVPIKQLRHLKVVEESA